jgi:hypothetical protein
MSNHPDYKFCTNCGAKLHFEDRFCTQCGTKCPEAGDLGSSAQAHGEAAFLEGHKYLKGDGVQKDFAAAQHKFQEAASQGHKEAPVWVEICQHYLDIVALRKKADAIRQGKYVPQDEPAGPVHHGVAPEGERHAHGNASRGRSGGSNLGKYAAGAVVGAAAASMLHQGANAIDPDYSQDDAASDAPADVPEESSGNDSGGFFGNFFGGDDNNNDGGSDGGDSGDSGDSGSSDDGGLFGGFFGGDDSNDDGGGFFGGGGDDDGFF